jgi:hypothetical protein
VQSTQPTHTEHIMAKGTIKLNINTRGHRGALLGLGYKVGEVVTTLHLIDGEEKKLEHFEVEGEFVDELDLRGPLEEQGEALRAFIRGGKLLSYGSIVLTDEGPRKGFMKKSATSFLKALGLSLRAGDLSCLIAQPQGKESKKTPPIIPTTVDPSWLGLAGSAK